MSERAERLKRPRAGAGFRSARSAAASLGVPYSTYAGHENGSRDYEADDAALYARRYRVTPEWLLFGRVTEVATAAVVRPFGGSPESLVPVYDVRASAGFGAVVDGEEVIAHMAFSPAFLRSMTDAKPRDLAVIEVKGHSMEPTLIDGDHVLIDGTKRNLDYDGLFVLRFGDALHVKRVGRSAKRGHVMVLSDHPGYAPLDMPKEEIDAIGRVLWFGRQV
jgi:phage repressor protein C with HTH and peptisase S24 domain